MKIGIMSSQNNASTPGGGGGGGFVLSDLFAGAEAGAALDMYTTNSGLWQDTAGTTQSEAVNDPIRRVDDVSGNGNHATYAGTTPFQLAGSAGAWFAQTQNADDRLELAGTATATHWVVILDSQGDASSSMIWGPTTNDFMGTLQSGSGLTHDANYGSPTCIINGNTATTRDNVYDELVTGAQPKMVRLEGVSRAGQIYLTGFTAGGGHTSIMAIRGLVYRDTAFTAGELADIKAYFDAN